MLVNIGIEIIKDNEIAFNLFIVASTEENHILAQYFVGQCYEFGHGIEKNGNLAFKYYKKLAKKDYAIGQFKVDWFYDCGIGVKKDLQEAIYWYERAVSNGNIAAIYNLGLIYFSCIDYQKALVLFKQSAEEEYLDGIMMLGYCYDSGIGIDIDRPEAFKLYQRAANLGDKEAQYNLANMYEKGSGTEKDKDKAIYWYEQAANQGHQRAHNKLEFLRNSSDNFCMIF